MADGAAKKLSRVGSVMLNAMEKGRQQDVALTEKYLAPELSWNNIPYGKLERKGFGLVYEGANRALARRCNGEVVFDILMKPNVLYAKTGASLHDLGMSRDVLMVIVT